LLDKKQSKIPGAVKDIAIIVIGVAIVWLGLRFVFDTNNPFYVVSSGSMIPTLNVNDVLIVRDGHSFKDLKIGDIIVFNRPEGGDRVIVHRVAKIETDFEGARVITTKGDANPSIIPGTDYPISADDYIGKVIFVIPGIGLVTKVISPPVNYIIIAVILAVLFFSRVGRKGEDSDERKDEGADSNSSPSSPASQPPSDSPK
jgi:signal peptidase